MATIGERFLGSFSWFQYGEFMIRLIVSCICGACIGYERTKRLKEAGVRTHIIVCCAAALTMLISKYGFADLTTPSGELLYGTHGTDPARLAAQIISGVSFLGAGMIFRNGNSVRGLTTAAGIWATAGIGLAIGAGMYCTWATNLLQRRLIELGYLPSGSADGVYGSGTAAALSAFQAKLGMAATGAADVVTQEKLYADDAPTVNER